MHEIAQPPPVQRFRLLPGAWLLLACVALVLVALFANTFVYLFDAWHREEYSHGFLVPVISAYLLWQRRAALAAAGWRGSWAGVALLAAGLAVYFVGMLASITTIDAYAFVLVLMGAVWALLGWPAFRIALVPLALLLLMNPIPNFFYYNLSSQLQLWSSQLGVAFIRLCGVSVFLEGNVIDLGSYKLQVAEACSGLRYLFPLMTLGVIIAYLFRGRRWMRWLLFLSTVPITLLMNSLRIGIIGVLVDRYGPEQAEGFLHQFEGWVVFMACLAVLLLEAWLLLRLSGDGRRFRDVFALEALEAGGSAPATTAAALSAPALAALLLLLAALFPARALPQRVEERPARADFAEFPLQLGDYHGRRQALESVYLDTLKLDDYVLADFSRPASGGVAAAVAAAPVNLYVAYYASQRTGESAHSPRSCLPGGGWRMLEFGVYPLPAMPGGFGALRVNRAIVQQGTSRQLVYYWFQERGRDITSEYLVKWYLLEDALTRNRTDGALVRLITPLTENEPAADGDARLAAFARQALPELRRYLPD